MACGDKYRHMIRNSLGGTPEDPCPTIGPDYCNDADHGAWNEAARGMLRTKVDPAWTIYTGHGGKDEALFTQYSTYLAGVVGLVAPSGFRLPGEHARLISQAISNMELGACLLEQLDDAIVAVGGKPPKIPGTGDASGALASALPWVAGGIILTGLVVGGYNYYRYRKRRKTAPLRVRLPTMPGSPARPT